MTEETKPAEPPAEEPVSLDTSTEVATETETKVEGETKEAGETAGEEQPKKPSGAARAKIREQRLLGELQAREREIEELRRSAPAKPAGETEKAPVEADFNGDYFAFRDATSAFNARQAIRDELRKDREANASTDLQTKQAEVARERSVAHLERVEDARDTITDFDQVMAGMKNVNVRKDIIEEIMSSDKSALLSYHLAKNPDKLAAMDGMSTRELAREMGRLEAMIDLPVAKKQTTAPAPLAPLKGGASGSFDPEKASMDDYVAKRKSGWG